MRFLTAILVVALAGPVASVARAAVGVDQVRVRQGDDPGWAAPALDDSGWEAMRLRDVPPSDPIVWIRATVQLEADDLPAGRPLGLLFGGMATCEVYWDGIRLPGKGIVGASAAEEVPGPIEALFHVPDRLATLGPHVIAMRCSTHLRHFNPGRGYWFVWVAEYDRLVNAGSSYTWTSMVSLSGMVLAGLFYFLVFALDRTDRASLVLAGLCMAAAALLVAEAYRQLFGYTYNWQFLRLLVVTGLAWLVNNLLLLFLAIRFPMRRRGWLPGLGLVVITVVMFLPRGWDSKTAFMFLSAFILGTIWCLAALVRFRGRAVLPTLGVAGCLGVMLLDPYRFADQTFFLAMDGLLLCLLASHAIRVRQIRREREAARLKSARLEAELLQRHLQPHFLMNTLTALSEWIEEDPQVATRMIDALSEEFHALAAVSRRRLIRLDEELRLCQSHLEVMGLRKGCDFRLRTEECEPGQQVPPALIHTLLENAITHNPYGETRVEFTLGATADGQTVSFTFDAPLADPAPTSHANKVAPPEGTGYRYIRARLEESFPGAWRLEAGRQNGFFRTSITLPRMS